MAKQAVGFIMKITEAANISSINIHAIPRNYDLMRLTDEAAKEKINKIKEGYDAKYSRRI